MPMCLVSLRKQTMTQNSQTEIFRRRLAVAQGRKPADCIYRGAFVLNVFTGRAEPQEIAVADGYIAAVGFGFKGQETVDLGGACVIPGLIDVHVHIESSHLAPAAFGAAVLSHGTTAVVADPHEIANVLGEEGLSFMLEEAKKSPCDIRFVLPSTVPASPHETSASVLDAETTSVWLRDHPELLGLGELMDVPGILSASDGPLAKIAAASGRALDGHFPGGTGLALQAYAGLGISSDHEATTAAEAREKIALGIRIFIREGSGARNLEALLPAVTDETWPMFCFCADDLCSSDLVAHGDVIHAIRRAVSLGLDPVRAVQIGSINAARHYGLVGRGAIAPGYRADFVAVDDFRGFSVRAVVKNGEVFRGGAEGRDLAAGTVRLPDLSAFRFPDPPAGAKKARLLRVLPTELTTPEDHCSIADIPSRDVARLAVIERHGKNGNIAYALAEGTGLKRGAVALTISHDSHNLVVLGATDADMRAAALLAAGQGGGVAVVENGQVLASMPLPVAGLMSGRTAEETAALEHAVLEALRGLGVTLPSPLTTFSFLALPVIPELKLTDRGLFDVRTSSFVPIYF